MERRHGKGAFFFLSVFLLLLLLLELTARLVPFDFITSPSKSNRKNQRFFLNSHEKQFRQYEAAAKKQPEAVSPGEIFFIGGSTILGLHTEPEVTVVNLAERLLRDEGISVRAYNFGESGTDISFALDGVRSLISKRPAAIIVYSGHNEFLPGNAKKFRYQKHCAIHKFLIRNSYFYRHFREFIRRYLKSVFPAGPEALTVEDEAEARGLILQDYERDLREIVKLGKEYDVPIFLSAVASNYRDWRPGGASLGEARFQPESDEWHKLYRTGTDDALAGDYQKALMNYAMAQQIDATHAMLHFDVAKVFDRTGNPKAARTYYMRAIRYDTVPRRALPEQNEIIRRVCAGEGCLLDTEAMLESVAKDGLLGNDLFDDYCHPNLYAKYLMAAYFANSLLATKPVLGGGRVEPIPVSRELFYQLLKTASLKPDYPLKVLRKIIRHLEKYPGNCVDSVRLLKKKLSSLESAGKIPQEAGALTLSDKRPQSTLFSPSDFMTFEILDTLRSK